MAITVGTTLGISAIGDGVRWAIIRGTTLGITDLMAMVGTIRGMTLGTTATTAGAIPITGMAAMATVGAILTVMAVAAMLITKKAILVLYDITTVQIMEIGRK